MRPCAAVEAATAVPGRPARSIRSGGPDPALCSGWGPTASRAYVGACVLLWQRRSPARLGARSARPPWSARRTTRPSRGPPSRRTHVAGHLGPAGRPGGDPAVRRARGRPAAGGDHRARRPSGTTRSSATSPAQRCACSTNCASSTAGSTRRSRSATTAAPLHVELNHTDPTVLPVGLPHRRQRRPDPGRGAEPGRRGRATSRWSPRTCRCGSRRPRSGWPPTSTAHGQATTPAGPAWPSSSWPTTRSDRAVRRRGARPPARRGDAALPHRAGAALAARLGAGPGAPGQAACAWSAATGRRSACAAARPSSGSRSTCCSTTRDRHRLARWPGRHRQVRAGAVRRPGGGAWSGARHRKVIVFRPLYAVGGQELGYLPGSETEKMSPWAQAVFDTLGAVASHERDRGGHRPRHARGAAADPHPRPLAARRVRDRRRGAVAGAQRAAHRAVPDRDQARGWC